jgi:hypothetical protein
LIVVRKHARLLRSLSEFFFSDNISRSAQLRIDLRSVQKRVHAGHALRSKETRATIVPSKLKSSQTLNLSSYEVSHGSALAG